MRTIEYNPTQNIISILQPESQLTKKDKLRVSMLKLIANDFKISEIEIFDRFLAQYYYLLAQKEADKEWEKKKYTDADVEKWLTID